MIQTLLQIQKNPDRLRVSTICL